MAADPQVFIQLYFGPTTTHSAELVELARLCCTRHDLVVASNYTEGRAATTEIDSYYEEAARLGFEGSRVMWRRYVVGKREGL